MESRRHHREVFGHYVERFNGVLWHLRHTAAYRAILKRGGIDGLLLRLHEVPRALQRRVRHHGGGYVNHELFFRTLQPCAKGEGDVPLNAPDGPLLLALEQRFGSFEAFQAEFVSATKQVLSSGWVWLVADTAPLAAGAEGLSLAIVDTPANDHPLMLRPSYVPVLCLDLWEHAYFGQFYNNRRSYIEAWWRLVNWDEVARIYTSIDLESRLSGVLSPRLDFASDAIAAVSVDEEDIFQDALLVDDPSEEEAVSSFGAAAAAAAGDEEEGGASSSGGRPSRPPTEKHFCEAINGFLARLRAASGGPRRIRCAEPAERREPWLGQPPAAAVAAAAASIWAAPAAVSVEGAAAGEELLVWPEDFVLAPKGALEARVAADEGGPAAALGGLVAALIEENRHTDSRWGEYLEFLHEAYPVVQQSALFWPPRLLQALNATLGLLDIRAAAQAHRWAAAAFADHPELLARARSATDESAEGPMPLFDAEVYWAVGTAFSRGVEEERTGRRILLPGSELVLRGDNRSANSRLVPPPAAGAAGAWRLVSTRRIAAGEALVLDPQMTDLELLVRAWPALKANVRGPVVPLGSFRPADLEATTALARAAAARADGEGGPARAAAWRYIGGKWNEWSCEDELQALHVSGDPRAPAFPRALVLCMAFTIRLLELADGGEGGGLPRASASETGGGGGAEGDGVAAEPWKNAVLEQAYGFVAASCAEAAAGYDLAAHGLEEEPGEGAAAASPQGADLPGVQEALHHAFAGGAALLRRCEGRAQRLSARRRQGA